MPSDYQGWDSTEPRELSIPTPSISPVLVTVVIFERFMRSLEAMGRSSHTQANYRWRLQPFVVQFAETPIEEISRHDIDGFVVNMRRRDRRPFGTPDGTRLAPASIAGYIQGIQYFFKWCIENGYLEDNPAAHLKAQRYDVRQTKRAMSKRDFEAMLRIAALRAATGNHLDIRNLAMLAWLGDTLCRSGETAAMRLQGLRLDQPFNHGKQEIYEAVVHGKSGRRLVSFTKTTARYLRAWLDVRPACGNERLFVSLCRYHEEANHPTCALCKKACRPINPSGVATVTRTLGELAGCTGRTNPHSIRHMGGHAYTKRAGIHIAQEKLGHATMAVTEMFYYDGDAEGVRRATGNISIVSEQEEDEAPASSESS